MPKAKPESITARFEKLKADVEALAKRLKQQEDRPDVAVDPHPSRNEDTYLDSVEPANHHGFLWAGFAILLFLSVMQFVYIQTHYDAARNPNPSATVSTPPAAPVVEPAISSEPTMRPLSPDGDLVRTGGLILQLTVNRECWMEGDSDGQKIPGKTQHAGSTWNIGALHEISIRNGCPGGLDYKVNGKETSPVNLSNNPKIEVVKFESEIASR